MDLLGIWRLLWRHRLLVLPVAVLTVAGAVWAIVMRPPLYEASASYLLLNPPRAPSPEEVAADPSLASVNADNPYTRVYDPGLVIEVAARGLFEEQAKDALVAAGADPRYTVVQAVRYGYSSPLAEVHGLGDTPAEAMRTAQIVGDAFVQRLRDIQAVEGVDETYFVQVRTVDLPTEATLRASNKLRGLIAVMVLGTVLLFVVISLAEARLQLQAQRRATRAAPHTTGEDGPDADAAPSLRWQPLGVRPRVATGGAAQTVAEDAGAGPAHPPDVGRSGRGGGVGVGGRPR